MSQTQHRKMSLGVTLQEVEETKDKPLGFFPQLYENVCKKLTTENYENLQNLKDDTEGFLRYLSTSTNN